jgi:hypothetical protein
MKTVTLMLMAGALLFAQDKTSQERKAPPTVKPAAGAKLPDIPAGAKEIQPGLYRYTDAEGKTWLMRRTPFGVGKWEDKPGDASAAPAPAPVPVTVTDLGDSYQFARKTPFGENKWTKKKTELNDEEKALVKGDQSKQSGENPPDGKQPEKPREKE